MTTATAPTTLPDRSQTVGAIVTSNPAAARVFEELRIDYCCQGSVTLGQACSSRGLDADEVLRRVLDAGPGSGTPDIAAMSLAELSAHIVATHHEPLRREIPRVTAMLEKCIAAHGDREPRLQRVSATFGRLVNELLLHMEKEEQILFPWITSIETGKSMGFPRHAVGQPIACMMNEHDDAGAAFAEIRDLTDGYRAPAEACPTWHALYGSLHDMEQDLHRHVHKENSVLFPRTLDLAGVAGGCEGHAASPCHGRRT